MEELLKSLGIDKKGMEGDGGSYVVDIDNYDEFGKMYAILEKAQQEDKIEQLEESSIINVHTTDVTYAIFGENEDETFEISLLGDLDQDIYKLVVTQF